MCLLRADTRGMENPWVLSAETGRCMCNFCRRMLTGYCDNVQAGDTGLSIWENEVRGGRGGEPESAPGGAGGVGGPSSRRRGSGGSRQSVWDADQDTTDRRLGHSGPLLLTTLGLEGQDQGAGKFHVWGQPSSLFTAGRLLAVSSWGGRGKELQGPVPKGTGPIVRAPCS